MNTATDALSRLETEPTYKIVQKTVYDIPTKLNRINRESRGISQLESALFETTDPHETIENQFWRRKEETRRTRPRDSPVIAVSCYYANDLQKEITIVNIAQLTKPCRMLMQEDSDPTILISKHEI